MLKFGCFSQSLVSPAWPPSVPVPDGWDCRFSSRAIVQGSRLILACLVHNVLFTPQLSPFIGAKHTAMAAATSDYNDVQQYS